jgi:polyhydroxyalkanoate synthesis regulator phasin
MAGKVNVPIGVAVQGLANTQKQLQMLTKGVSGVGKSAGIAAVGFAAFVGAIRSADFAAQAIAGARDLERNVAGLNTVFEDSSFRMQAFSRQAVEMGLSLNEASKSSVFIGSVLKQSGFSIAETADLTERLVGLATDLSITYGYDVQEALLGMTALFRGEYDPIEKFGVAMKQSEINAELAARGFAGLEGAARRYAEQQIRVELLFQRSQDAQGALTRQSGTLAVEQLKLAATFANVRDTVATSVLPVIADLMIAMREVIEEVGPKLSASFRDLTPRLKTLIEGLLPVFESLADMAIDAFDAMIDGLTFVQENWTILSTLAVGVGTATVAFNLFTVSLVSASAAFSAFTAVIMANPFAAAAAGLIGLAFAMNHVTSSIDEETDPAFQDLRNRADELGSAVDRMNPKFAEIPQYTSVAGMHLEDLANKAIYLNRQLVDTTSLTGILAASNMTLEEMLGPVDLGASVGSGQPAVNHVRDFFDSIEEEIDKQRARRRLANMGASQGLIDSILGSEGWEQVLRSIVSGGRNQLLELQEDFNATQAGINEINAAQAEAARLAEQQAEAAAAAALALQQQQEAYDQLVESLKRFNDEVRDLVIASVLPTIAREVGKFESEVVRAFDNVQESLESALDNGTIYQAAYNQLVAFAQSERVALEAIARQRDELAEKGDWVESLIRDYRSAFTSAAGLTDVLGQLESKTREVTVTETSKGVRAVAGSVKELRYELTRTYTETISETINKTEALTKHFQDIAAKARLFATNLRTLHDMGLDPQLFSELVQAGVEAGGETAQALIDGGAETIKEINSLYQEIADTGVQLGEHVAEDFYATGESFGSQLLEGIRSQQAALEEAAREMAQTFQDNFNVDVSTATQQVADVAQFSNQISALVEKQQRFTSALAEQQAKLAAGGLGPGARAAAERKIARYSTQIAELGAEITRLTTLMNTTQVTPLATGGITLGSTLALIGEEGPEAVIPLDRLDALMGSNQGPTNVYNINVAVDSTKSPAQVGQAIVTAINAFGSKGGSVATNFGSISTR